MYQDRRLTSKVIGRFLASIRVEALRLFVLLFLAIVTCRIEETFSSDVTPVFQASFNFSFGFFSFFPSNLYRLSSKLSRFYLQNCNTTMSQTCVLFLGHSFIHRLHNSLVDIMVESLFKTFV